MAVPTFATDLVTISDAESTTGWLNLANMAPSLDTDSFVQGANSIGLPAAATDSLIGATFDLGAATDITGQHLFIWLRTNSALTANYAVGGVRVRVSTSVAANTDFGEWTVGGRDIQWCQEGWRLVVVDTSRPFDFTGGVAPANMTAIRRIGATMLPTGAQMSGNSFNIDIMRRGTKIAITGGTDADPITLQETFDQDMDPANTVYGIVTKNKAGVFEINGELRIGVEAGAGNTVFSSQNELVTFQDQPCTLDYLKILSQQGTGTTKVKFGTGTGTGDARVGVNGSVFDRINTIHGREYSLSLGASINLVEFFGTTVLRAKRGTSFPNAIGHEVISSSFVASGQIDLGQTVARKNIFSGHGLTDTGIGTFSVTADAVDSGAITVNVTAGTRTYTRTAGSFLTDGFEVGMVVTMSGFINANNNGRKRIKSVTATDMVVERSQTLVTETGDANERVRLEFAFTRSIGSFITNGFTKDMAITPSGFVTSANNLTRVITNVTATRIAMRELAGLAAEAGGGDERIRSAGATGDSALLWNGSINIQNTSFLGNTNSAANAAAIQHPSAVGSPFTYNKLTFSGNNFDINNTSGAAITINATNGANPVTSKGSAVSIQNTVTLKVTVVDKDTNPIPTAQVAIYKTSDNTELMNQDTETVTAGLFVVGVKYIIVSVGTTDFTLIGASSNTVGVVFTATGVGSGTGTASNGIASVSNFNFVSDTAIYIRVRKSSAAATKYTPVSTIGTITSSGFSLLVTLATDDIVT